jgi:hypothetical protein
MPEICSLTDSGSPNARRRTLVSVATRASHGLDDLSCCVEHVPVSHAEPCPSPGICSDICFRTSATPGGRSPAGSHRISLRAVSRSTNAPRGPRGSSSSRSVQTLQPAHFLTTATTFARSTGDSLARLSTKVTVSRLCSLDGPTAGASKARWPHFA